MSSVLDIAQRLYERLNRTETEAERMGRLLRHLRVHLDLSLRDAAEIAKVDALTFAEYERGVKAPDLYGERLTWEGVFKGLIDHSLDKARAKRPAMQDLDRDAQLLFGLVIEKLGALNRVIRLERSDIEHAHQKKLEITRRDVPTGAIEFSVVSTTKICANSVVPVGSVPGPLDKRPVLDVIWPVVEHNAKDKYDYARQWFYNVLAEFEKRSGVAVTVVNQKGDPEWRFLDGYLPFRLAEIISPSSPSTSYIDAWLKKARRRKAESMKAWRERLTQEMLSFFAFVRHEEQIAVAKHLEDHAKGYEHGGQTTIAAALVEKAGQIRRGDHRKSR